MSSDFKNLFIGANNSKRIKSNLLDSEKDPINSHSYYLSLMPAFKEYKEAKSQLPLFKISVNSNQPLSAQLNEYDRKKSALKYSASGRVVSSSKLLLNYDF
ncbi:hypothetical protein [Helicobacter pylori]|uniref:hypothetical protein n=1 Tax=Helicobacter pylori TaxID=210 RepID=UPI001F092B8F|nr:hypothetical protein [Helicobacter pylori]